MKQRRHHKDGKWFALVTLVIVIALIAFVFAPTHKTNTKNVAGANVPASSGNAIRNGAGMGFNATNSIVLSQDPILENATSLSTVRYGMGQNLNISLWCYNGTGCGLMQDGELGDFFYYQRTMDYAAPFVPEYKNVSPTNLSVPSEYSTYNAPVFFMVSVAYASGDGPQWIMKNLTSSINATITKVPGTSIGNYSAWYETEQRGLQDYILFFYVNNYVVADVVAGNRGYLDPVYLGSLGAKQYEILKNASQGAA